MSCFGLKIRMNSILVVKNAQKHRMFAVRLLVRYTTKHGIQHAIIIPYRSQIMLGRLSLTHAMLITSTILWLWSPQWMISYFMTSLAMSSKHPRALLSHDWQFVTLKIRILNLMFIVTLQQWKQNYRIIQKMSATSHLRQATADQKYKNSSRLIERC